MGITGTQPALMYARAKSAGGSLLTRPPRAGACRSNYFGPAVALSVNGTTRHNNFDRETWRWTERAKGGQPSQLTVDVFGFTPANGQAVIFAPGALTNQPFKGTIVRVSRRHTRLNEGRLVYHLTCLDWLYQLQGILVTKRYTSQTATAILLDLLSTYAPAGFTTTTYVQTALDTIDEIQFTMVPLAAAIEQVLDRIGGYSYWDAEKRLHAFTLETTGAMPEAITTSNPHTQAIDYDTDIEGVRNGIQVEGLGGSVRAPIAVGGTTIPLDDVSPFDPAGGYAKLEAQRIAYAGVAAGGESGSTSGYVLPPAQGVFFGGTGGSLTAGATYLIAWGYGTVEGYAIGPTSSVTLGGGENEIITSTAPIPTDPKVTTKSIWLSTANGGVATMKKFTDYSLSVTGTPTIVINTPAAGIAAPTSNTAGFSNVSTPAGSTTIEVEDLAQFPASGWAEAPGGQVFSYTGRSAATGGGTLTGIPASGLGSLTAAVRAGTIKAVPQLTGVSGIAQALKVGESVNILVITEDAASILANGRREMPVQDRRLSLAGAADRGAAILALLKDARVSGRCVSSDPKMRARRPLTITVSEWGISVTVTVQSVTIRPDKNRPQPMADVEFASRSLEDLFVTLREIKERALIR